MQSESLPARATISTIDGLQSREIATFGVGLGVIVIAVLYFGIAQAIDILGRSAYYAERLSSFVENQLTRQI